MILNIVSSKKIEILENNIKQKSDGLNKNNNGNKI